MTEGSSSSTTNGGQDSKSSLIEEVACELESMRKKCTQNDDGTMACHHIPSTCLEIIQSLPGNQSCIDCQARNPDWVTISYGALLCMNCASKHRSLGVNYSKVRSLTMDHFSAKQVLILLEGGNQQLRGFFERHELSTDENSSKRYFTKAARFYRSGIDQHVTKLAKRPYEGREASRRGYSCSSSRQSIQNCSSQ